MIDPAFDPVMPERVRDGVRELFASWGDGDVRARVNSMLAYLHRTDRDPEIGGWLAGMLVFVDVHQRLITALEYYPEVIPFALDAVIAGIGANVKGPRRLWLLVERLVVRTSRRPPGLVPALVTACGDNYDVTHAAARTHRRARRSGSTMRSQCSRPPLHHTTSLRSVACSRRGVRPEIRRSNRRSSCSDVRSHVHAGRCR